MSVAKHGTTVGMSGTYSAIEPSRNSKPRGISVDELVLGLMLLLLCLQNLVVVDFGSFSLKYCHLFFLVFLLYTLMRAQLSFAFPPGAINGVFMLLFILTGIAYPKTGFNSVIFNYIFMYGLIVTVYSLVQHMDMKRVEKLIQTIAWLMMVTIYIKIALNVSAIRKFYANSWAGHPVIDTFFGGGVNLEASWMALFATFFHPNRRGGAYLFFAILLSMLYASRTGLIICMLSLMYVFGVKSNNKGFVLKMITAGAIAFAVLVILYLAKSPVVDRLLAIGEDSGSEGRLRMWEYAWPAFLKSPLLGSGAGSAVSVLDSISGLGYNEGNIHNYYMQVAIDFGAVGFLSFLYLLIKFTVKEIRFGIDNPYAAYISIYFLAAFIQFRGADALAGFMLGCYFAFEVQRGTVGLIRNDAQANSLSEVASSVSLQ